MAKYNQYCPVARASEIFADRWTPLIVRELLLGSRHFNEIERGLPGISRSLLVSRLRHLEDSGVVERHAGKTSNVTEYVLTEAGCGLRDVIEHLGAWGVKWAFDEPASAELDPALLLWKIHQRIHRHELPPGRTVVQFDVTGRKCRRLWLVLTPKEVSVCLKPPGFDSDLFVRADLLSLYRVWFGHVEWNSAVRRGELAVEGPSHLVRALPRWLMWSPMARFVRALHDPQRDLHNMGLTQEVFPH
jgi:DNA-binding HxlR family transcriptional regulator